MYHQGQGVIQDYQEAVKWYRLAAAQGVVDAQGSLGVIYGNGLGVIKDPVRAYMWFNLVAARGNSQATEKRDVVAKEMTSIQLEKAQKMSRECLDSNYKKCD